MNIREILVLSPVIPVLTVSDLKHAVPLARAMTAAGLRVLEITLQTPVAIRCIEAIRKHTPEPHEFSVGFDRSAKRKKVMHDGTVRQAAVTIGPREFPVVKIRELPNATDRQRAMFAAWSKNE